MKPAPAVASTTAATFSSGVGHGTLGGGGEGQDTLWMVGCTTVQKPWNLFMIPMEIPANNDFKHGFKVVRTDFVHPQENSGGGGEETRSGKRHGMPRAGNVLLQLRSERSS